MTTPIFELCERYVTRQCELDPVSATYRGVAGDFAAGTDYGPDGHAARAEHDRRTLAELATLTPTGPADELAADHLRERLEGQLASYELGEHLRMVRAPFGLLQSLRNSVELMPRSGEGDWEKVVARVAAVPWMLDTWRASLSGGMARGLVAARRQALEAAAQADRYAEAGSFQQVVAAYGDGPLRDRLAEAAEAADRAYGRIAAWLRDVYAPAAAEADGVGRERYAVASRLVLGAEVDPVEAYHWGFEELRRIEDEMAAEAERIRAGTTVDEVIAHLDDTAFVTGVDAYRAWLQERHDEALARLDGVHFDIAPALKRVEVVVAEHSSAGAAYYTPPSEDLSRPGRTWWPAAGRKRFTVWDELTTVFHEGVPGHHLQVGQLRVLGDRLSRFSRLSGVNGHAEGWALYAERLADELGWFEEPGTRLGMLIGSALRAARVVVDIGIHLDLPLPEREAERHGPRWTFETALDVLRRRGRLPEHRLHPELVRYCGWPAQATAYKLGERAWLAARQEAKTRLGTRFDLKRWHTEALALGPVGLATLGERLRRVD